MDRFLTKQQLLKWSHCHPRYVISMTSDSIDWVFLQVPSSQKKQRDQTIEFFWRLHCLVDCFFCCLLSVPRCLKKEQLIYLWVDHQFACDNPILLTNTYLLTESQSLIFICWPGWVHIIQNYQWQVLTVLLGETETCRAKKKLNSFEAGLPFILGFSGGGWVGSYLKNWIHHSIF